MGADEFFNMLDWQTIEVHQCIAAGFAARGRFASSITRSNTKEDQIAQMKRKYAELDDEEGIKPRPFDSRLLEKTDWLQTTAARKFFHWSGDGLVRPTQYDDPKEIEEQQVRSALGQYMAEGETIEIEELMESLLREYSLSRNKIVKTLQSFRNFIGRHQDTYAISRGGMVRKSAAEKHNVTKKIKSLIRAARAQGRRITVSEADDELNFQANHARKLACEDAEGDPVTLDNWLRTQEWIQVCGITLIEVNVANKMIDPPVDNAQVVDIVVGYVKAQHAEGIVPSIEEAIDDLSWGRISRAARLDAQFGFWVL